MCKVICPTFQSTIEVSRLPRTYVCFPLRYHICRVSPSNSECYRVSPVVRAAGRARDESVGRASPVILDEVRPPREIWRRVTPRVPTERRKYSRSVLIIGLCFTDRSTRLIRPYIERIHVTNADVPFANMCISIGRLSTAPRSSISCGDPPYRVATHSIYLTSW